MWSLPHTESNPRRSHRSAVGRMSDGFAKGTGYIIPSIQVGMWTPNRMALPLLLPRRPRGLRVAPDVLGQVALGRQDRDRRVQPRRGPAGELATAVLGRARHRERIDDRVVHQIRGASAPAERLAERAGAVGPETGVQQDGLAV